MSNLLCTPADWNHWSSIPSVPIQIQGSRQAVLLCDASTVPRISSVSITRDEDANRIS